jgi:hypothetical protein
LKYPQNSAMKAAQNRFILLVLPALTAIGLIVSYGIWLVVDELTRSVYGSWPLVGIALAIGLLIASPGLFRRAHRKIHMVLIASYIAALIIGWNLDWSPAKPFYRFYSGIRVGMTVPEVQQRLDQSFPPNGPYPKPRTEDTSSDGQIRQLYRLEPPLSAELITVEFAQGRVTKTEYLLD